MHVWSYMYVNAWHRFVRTDVFTYACRFVGGHFYQYMSMSMGWRMPVNVYLNTCICNYMHIYINIHTYIMSDSPTYQRWGVSVSQNVCISPAVWLLSWNHHPFSMRIDWPCLFWRVWERAHYSPTVQELIEMKNLQETGYLDLQYLAQNHGILQKYP